MTVLTDQDIKVFIDHDELGIDPFDEESQLQPASVDLRLGNEVYCMKTHKRYEVEDSVELRPARHGHFYLCHTEEFIDIPTSLAADLRGRSSVARKGIMVHCAGWVDPGFNGQLVLEVANFRNDRVELPVGQRVAQLVFHKLDRHVAESYSEKNDAKYSGQTGAQTSRLENHDRR